MGYLVKGAEVIPRDYGLGKVCIDFSREKGVPLAQIENPEVLWQQLNEKVKFVNGVSHSLLILELPIFEPLSFGRYLAEKMVGFKRAANSYDQEEIARMGSNGLFNIFYWGAKSQNSHFPAEALLVRNGRHGVFGGRIGEDGVIYTETFSGEKRDMGVVRYSHMELKAEGRPWKASGESFDDINKVLMKYFREGYIP